MKVNGNHRPALRVCSLRGVRVLATGSYAPSTVLSNEQLQAALGCDPDWVLKRTGIRERRHAAAEEATSDLAVRAARNAIERAGVSPEDIDLLVVGTFTPDMPLPSTACIVQDALGINAPAVDVQAACSGFIYALVTGMQFVKTGCSRLALVVGADCMSRIINPQDVRTYPLFGDAAGAVLLAPGSDEQGLLSYNLGADGSGAKLLQRPVGGSRFPPSCELLTSGGQYLLMDGKPVFRWAVRVVEQSTLAVLKSAEKTVGDLDLVILHQANVRIVETAVESLKIERSKVVVNLDRYGNTSAGSVPLALDEAFDEGRVHPGSLILLAGFGGGLTWGTALLRW